MLADNYHLKKLKDNHINIKSKYLVDNQILERNTDDSYNDNITKGICVEKEYYINNKLTLDVRNFDSRIEYSFINPDLSEDYTCINCGNQSKMKDFVNGCPYCGTSYNIDFLDKELGNKYHYDLVLSSNKYRIIVGIIDIIISIIISYFFIKATSRTFNNIDVMKVFVYGIILAMILYYAFYLLDAYIILGPIKAYKNRQNMLQREFWKRTNIDKKVFFNNLHFELSKYFYNKTDVIDYDILDYTKYRDYEVDDKLTVDVTLRIRIVTFNNNKIDSKIIEQVVTMCKYYSKITDLGDKTNLIKCPNCGSSIKVLDGECGYCHTKINPYQEWIMIK